MARWIHGYIEENSSKRERKRMSRMEERRKITEEWENNSRMEKIKILQEKFKTRKESAKTMAADDEDDDEEMCKTAAEM